jgi:hypothetical protein
MDNPYAWNNEKLVHEFMHATAKSANANSGLVIDVTGPIHAKRVHYLKGVLLARLDGKQPPFSPGAALRIKHGARVGGVWWVPQLSHDNQYTVMQVLYEDGKWLMTFKGVSEHERYGTPAYDADAFELVELVPA